jgi:hypothetical protein
MSKRNFLKVRKPEMKVIKGGKFFDNEENKANNNDTITLDYLRKLYNEGEGLNYTDEQLLMIKKFAAKMAEIAVESYKRMKRNNLIQSNNDTHDKTESHTLLEGKYRRTG